MKKFLSLVLALVMTMSLVTVSAGAEDFTDDSSITYEEAVDVMSAVKVIDGYTDGSFQPTTLLTRGAAAKIICNLILGPTTAAALGADTAPYSDVPTTNVFAGYIAYCQKEGIISGYADGTFRPSAPLTGYAFMKMLLGALGYDSVKEGYTGANWSVNVAKQAIAIGLDNGNDEFVGQATVNREEAMLYAFNTMKATMVEYPNDTTVTVGDATVSVSGEASKVADSGKYYDNISDDGYMQFAEVYFTKLTRIGTGADDFGRPANEWKYGAEVIGTYADDSTLIATYTAKAKKGDLYDLVSSSIVKDLGDKYELTVYHNGVEISDTVGNYFYKNSSEAAGVSGNGVLTQVFMDDDSDVTITFIDTYVARATSDYNSNKETVTIEFVDNGATQPARFPTSISNDDFNVENVKEDDYLLVTFANDSLQSVEEAELLSGKVTEYTVNEYVIIDGTKYNYQALVDSDVKGQEYTINENATVVMDAYDYVIFVDEAVSTNSYVYIQKATTTSGLQTKAIAAAYFTDGTSKEIDLVKRTSAAGVSVTNPTTLATTKGWYTYVVNADGEYSLTAVKAPRVTNSNANANGDGTNAAYLVSNSTVKFMGGSHSTMSAAAQAIKANANTIFMVLDQDKDFTVYTGIANVPNVIANKSIAADEVEISWVVKDGYAQFVFIDVSPDATDGVTEVEIEDVVNAADYLFILKQTNNKTVDAENNVYYQFEVVIDGEKTTRYIEESNVAQKGELRYNVKTNDKDYITKATLVDGTKSNHDYFTLTGATGDTITQKGNTITIGGQDYVIGADTELNLVVDKTCQALLKDKGASYEDYLNTTAGTIAGVAQGYDLTGKVYAAVDSEDNELLEVLWVYLTGATESTADKASLDSVTLDGEEITAYSSIASAVNNAVEVKQGETVSAVLSATATGTLTSKIANNMTASSTDAGTTWNDIGIWTFGSDGIYVVKYTVTSADGSDEIVRYVAFQPVAKHTLTVKTLSGSALVEIGGKQYTITTSGKTFDLKSTDSLTVVVKAVSGGNTLTSTTAALASTNATLWATGDQSWTVNSMSGDEDLELTLRA